MSTANLATVNVHIKTQFRSTLDVLLYYLLWELLMSLTFNCMILYTEKHKIHI